MVVGVVSAREQCLVMGVLVMEVVADDVVHASVSGDETGREEEDVEEGDTVEAVDVGMYDACRWLTLCSLFSSIGHVRWAGDEMAASSSVRPLVDLLTMEESAQLEPDLIAAVCTASGLPWLKDRYVDSWVVIVWVYSCWRDGGGFVIASLSLTFGVADLCGCLDFGGFRAVGRNSCSGIPLPQRCVDGLLHGGKRHLPPML
ncbi:hypothetical protein NDU88_001198 [Pleurodeles waltl]|uniref:Uncharacterized protein n=1 Tax=Pleurodeles waltl TaxID=8319 RepID=A0AAV7LCF0_PLEWA|nr:hypothetical protein NDU88_001198 [Pleurodeles waltl]